MLRTYRRKRSVGLAALGAALFVLSAIGGCLDEAGPPTAATDPLPAFPADYQIEGAQAQTLDAVRATFVWTGTAGLGADQEADAKVTPEPELALPVPAAIPLFLRIDLRYPYRAEVWLGLEVLDAKGAPACIVAPERENGGAWQNTCGRGVGPLAGPESWRIRVLTMANVDPTVPFEVEIKWRVVQPRDVPLVPSDLAPAPEAHVVVALTDSGVNPYHAVYYRPERTAHPCTYVEGYPCDIPALPLSVGVYDDYWEAVAADAVIWESVEPDTWYWVPQTSLIGVHCAEESRWRPACILDQNGHGTYTSSSILQENPEALIAITMGDAEDMPYIHDAPFPVDIVSFSWAPQIPLIVDEERVYAGACQNFFQGRYTEHGTLFIAASGNRPTSTLIDCATGNPNVVSVGGAFASERSQWLLANNHPDVVSWACRPAARALTLDEYARPCGTSFAAPTVAGTLSKVILELRRTSGYTGGLHDGLIDPKLGIYNDDLRAAMNLSATYAPRAAHDDTGRTCLPPVPVCAPTSAPVNPVAPWLQWGWGFYDATVANETLSHLLGDALATHPEGAIAWMEAQHEVKKGLWGS